MASTRRDDDRVRLLTIPDGWPARTVAQLLEAAAEATEEAAHGITGELHPEPWAEKPLTGYEARRHRILATAIVETRSDGLAVYAAVETKERRP